MTEKKEQKTAELNINPNTQTVWIDDLHMSVRQDNVCLIRLSTHLPEGHFEQVRFMTSKEQLMQHIDTMCALLNHYPTKPAEKKQPKESQKK